MAELRDTRIIVQALASSGGGGGVGGGDGGACSTSSSTSDRVGNVIRLPDFELAGAPLDVQVGKKKRGRPPRNPASAAAAVAAVASSAVAASKRSRKEEEDVCFICFDGGSLVMCDHRDCPKAYHPACVKRDESFFRPSIRWNCGWHLCNICQRNALFMCYTCPYSLCKGCVKQADILCVRGNKGFCRTCMTTILLIEKVPQENKELAAVDFDDSTSWEYLFKVYWIYLKEKEALTLDELLRASNPWKGTGIRNKVKFQQKAHGTYLSNAPVLSNNIAYVEADASKRRKTRKQQQSMDMELQKIDKVENTKVSSLLGGSDWASKELLEFVAHMKNGDMSAVSQFDVQALLLDYIRKNNLRDPRQKCQIICDKRLENLFGKERVGHFEMLKLLEYHYKEESRTNGVIRGAAMNPLSGLVEEGITEDIQTPSRDTRRQNRRKGDDKGRQINLDGYAAIDAHNINLVYLKRGLLETLTVDADKFHDKVVGSVVRIKISSNDQKQDMHRLVRIIGTSKATQLYKIGDKVENLMLKILNLNKIEDVTIDVISDQEFSEDECRRLRQSIKLGLVERMTVGEIQEKAMALQEVRVKDWLEAEIRRLNHLRDRASEMGHRKEELVEKIELLKTPEERQRRINEVPEVHADPRMDPSYGSDDDSGESDMKRRDGALTPRYSKSYSKGMELISPLRVGYMPKDDRARTLKPAAANGDRKRKHSAKFHVGRAEAALGSLEPSQKTERADAASGNLRVAAIGSTSQVNSNTSKVTPSGALLVSDISELEKIWHYRDPSGKVQGPFCLLQLRKWDSNGFFPNDLRVWKANEAYNQSILLTNALNKQQSSEPHFQQDSCLQSHDGAKNDDEKVDSMGVMNSNSVAPWVSDQANEECSKSNLTDTASTPEVNEQSVNGYRSQPDSDGQGQSSVQILKAQLIESLFNIEEPSSDATANKSPDMMHVDLKSESFHPSNAMSMSGNVDAKCPDAGRPDSGTSLPIDSESEEIKASNVPRSVPIPNHENMKDVHVDNEHHDESNGCEDFRVSCGTGSGALNVSDLPISLPKTHNNNYSGPDDKRCAGYGHEQGSISGGTNVTMGPSAAQEVENGGTKSYDTENRPALSLNIPGGDPSTSWATVSCGTDVSLLPSTNPKNGDTKVNTVESIYYAASNVPDQGSITSWSTISGGIMVSDLPSTSGKPETDGSKITIAENKGTPVSNIPGQDSGISWSNLTGGIGFSAIATAPLKLDVDGSRGVAVENNQCPPPHGHGQDTCISWSTASSLGGEVHLPDTSGEWGWQPIELSTLGDESVSDLLSEVEAMESLRGMSMACADDSIGSPGDDCFSPLGGLSPNLDPGKSDALSSTADIQFQMQANHILPNQRDQPHVSFHINVSDIPRTSCSLSTLGPGMEAEDKPVLSSVSHHNFVSQASVSLSLPAPVSSSSLVQHHDFASQAPVSLLPPPSLSPPPLVPHHNFVSQAPAPLLLPSCSSPPHPVPHHNLFSQSSVLSMAPPPPSPPRSEPRHNFVPEVPLVLLAPSPPQPPTPPPPATAVAKSPSPLADAATRSLSAAAAAPESLSPESAAMELSSPPSTSRKSPSPPPPSTSIKSPPPPPPSTSIMSPPTPPTAIKSPSPPPSAIKSPSPPPSAIKSSSQPPSAKKLPSSPPSAKKPPSPSQSVKKSPSQPPSAKKSPSPPPSAKKSPSPSPPSSAKKSHSPSPPSSAKKSLSPSPPFSVPPASKISLLPPQSPSAAAEMHPPPQPLAGAAKPRPPASAVKPRPPAAAAKPRPPAAAAIPHPPVAAAIPHPPVAAAIAHPSAAAPAPAPRPSTLRLDCSSSPREEGEVETVSIPVRREEEGPRDLRSPRTGTIKNSWKQGSEITNGGREQLGQSSGKFSGTSSILGSPNMHWSKSGQVMPTVGANSQWSPTVVNQGTRVSQTSPRYSHNVGRHPGPKDRSHHHQGVDSGFGKSRPTWNRQSSFGARGGSSRPLHQGQRVCKFYEIGYCRKGASCKYLHP